MRLKKNTNLYLFKQQPMHIILFALATHPTTENYNFQTWVHLLLMLIHLYISTVIAKCSCIFTLYLQIAWQNKSSFGWTSIRREAKLPTKNKGRNQNASQQFWRGARNCHYLAFCFVVKSWWFAPWQSSRDFSQYRNYATEFPNIKILQRKH